MRIITINSDRLVGMANDGDYRWVSSVRHLRGKTLNVGKCRSCSKKRQQPVSSSSIDWTFVTSDAFASQMKDLKGRLGATLLRIRVPGISLDF